MPLIQIATVLIEGRIAAGLTQKELAARLGMKQQQIQQYEQSLYQHVSLARLCQVSETLHLFVKEMSYEKES